VASPEFLGVLRKLLDPQLESAVRLEINKDYTQLGTKQIQEHVETALSEAKIKSLPEA
jgi:protein required for attachment to host cells